MAEIVFPKMYQHQKDVWDAVTTDTEGKRYVVVASRQKGKSLLASLLLIYFCLTKRRSINIIVEPTLNQSRRVFKQIVGMLQGSDLIKNANASLLSIDMANGSEIILKSAEQQESLRGMTATGIMVIDEAAFIKDDIFDILFPVVDVHKTPLLIISTPLFEDGYFYRLYKSPQSVTFNWSEYDTTMLLSDERLEEYRQTMPPLKFKSEYLGQFITDGSYVFGDIYSCVGDWSTDNPVYLGIDWASGNGGDYTCMTFLDAKHRVTFIDAFRDLEPAMQLERIAKLINNSATLQKVCVEKNSIGTVYASQLKRLLIRPQIVTEFVTTNESKRTIIEQLVTAFNKKEITIPKDNELLSELAHYAMEKTSKGYTYNGVNGNHDDYVMSLAFAYDISLNKKGNYNISFR